MSNFITYITKSLSGELKHKGTTVLTYKIDYPQIVNAENNQLIRKINQSIENNALFYEYHLSTTLLAQAISDYNFSIENNYPIHPYEAVTVYHVTYSNTPVFSYYTDQYEYSGGAHGSTLRKAQTWDISKGNLINLKDIFHCMDDYEEKVIFPFVKKQITSNPTIYYPISDNNFEKVFHPTNYFLTPEQIVIFYQQYDIAPYVSNIPEFPIPYPNC